MNSIGAVMSHRPSLIFEAWKERGALPECLRILVDTPQDLVHHPEGSVWQHTMMVLDVAATLKDQTSDPLVFMLTALVHDMGKPETTVCHENGKITAYGHAEAGVPIARAFLDQLDVSDDVKEAVLIFTHYHMHGHLLLEMREYNVRTLMQLLDIDDLILFGIADERGRKRSYVDRSKAAYDRVDALRNSTQLTH